MEKQKQKGMGHPENSMTLGEFIENFSHNNLIRLLYKIKTGHQIVLNNWNDVSTDWEVTKAKGPYRHYINNKVLGLSSILVQGHYPEALNIVIEKLEDQPFIEEQKDEGPHHECIQKKIT